MQIAHDLGNEVSAVYSTRQSPSKNPLLNEIAFFDAVPSGHSDFNVAWNFIQEQIRLYQAIKPVRVDLSGVVITRSFDDKLMAHDNLFIARNLFMRARRHFRWTKRFAMVAFDERPDIFHCTYQLPLRAKGARNIYTIHDLVPLRLPYTTLDRKRDMFRLLKKIGAEADHIVTVSENSKRDIIEVLGVDESRVTNTYQTVTFPRALADLSEDVVTTQLKSAFKLEYSGYLLFFGALEPKKNVGRLIEAYMASRVDIPLVLVTTGGWQNQAESRLIAAERRRITQAGGTFGRGLMRLEYVSQSALVTLIKGARAVLFPSLYEGFGLPVLEAMVLGTPVVTSKESSLPDVAGDAALLVDPYDVDDIAQAIRTVSADADLRGELVQRGKAQAQRFSKERYEERVKALYESL
jgi:glycosyltransferase involved in cell wall biosynthesis